MTIFNRQTNTSLNCGMGNNVNNTTKAINNASTSCNTSNTSSYTSKGEGKVWILHLMLKIRLDRVLKITTVFLMKVYDQNLKDILDIN